MNSITLASGRIIRGATSASSGKLPIQRMAGTLTFYLEMGMSERSITQFFSALRAPLRMMRQSWGAVRVDGAVFLRVWQDRCEAHDGVRYVQLTHLEKYGGDSSNFGYNERCAHVEKVRAGAPCYLVMCLAKDTEVSPRDIRSFNRDVIFVGGALIQLNDEWWIELAGKVESHKLMSDSI